MKDVISQVHEWIKLVSQVGIGLIALGVVVEIVFGKGAIFGRVSSKIFLKLFPILVEKMDLSDLW